MDAPKALGGRLLLLLPIAFCIYLLLVSQDQTVRLLAIVALIILEQIREWLLVSGIKGMQKGKGRGSAPAKG